MRITQLLEDNSIPFVTEHKNVRDGWIGIHCPFCAGEQNYHLGWSLDEEYFSCWKCGGHSIENTLSKLLGISYGKAEEIIREYGGTGSVRKEPVRIKVNTKRFKLPAGAQPLQSYHKHYLEKRGFDWEELQEMWYLLGTGPVAKVDDINYGRRILAPIYWEDRMVSFQARDITNKHMAKYMACPPERERISHKHILYGNSESWGDTGICVEGITDVWRLGPDAFATFGIKYTSFQVRAMVKNFKRVAILYDPENFAQAQAKKLVDELSIWGVQAWIEKLDCDPGELGQDEANDLVQYILS